MVLFETIAVAFAMFSAIPVPQPEWNQRNMRYALCAFPLVGAAVGLAWWGWAAVCGVLGFPALLRAAGFVLSRCLSGLSIACFPMAKDTGLAHTFASSADKGRVRVVLAVLAAGAVVTMWVSDILYGAAMTLAALAVFANYARTVQKQFGGLSGDLAGWFLQRAEFWMLAALVLCQHGEKLQ